MTVAEIFKELASHMTKGLMVHSQMADYYRFLGLNGYAECHEYHFLKETKGYRKLQRYYTEHYNKLIPESGVEDPKIIPESWFNYIRSDVDAATMKTAVKNALTEWVDWEAKTKELYQKMYLELLDQGEIASATFIKEYVCDTSEEHRNAYEYWLHKNAIGYDISAMISEQNEKQCKYIEMMKD